MKEQLVCEECGQGFESWPSNKARFCGMRCKQAWSGRRGAAVRSVQWAERRAAGLTKTRYIGNREREHRRVAEKMLGRPLLPGEVVHHIDGNGLNNAPSNLQVFASHSEHMRHHMAQTPSGADSPKSKLTQEQADEIRARRLAGEQGKLLAAEFGVSASVISSIVTGRRYVSPSTNPEAA